MSFLLHKDACAGFLRRVPAMYNRLLLHRGRLWVSALTVFELEIWLRRAQTPSRYLQVFGALMQQVQVKVVDEPVAHQAAVLWSTLRFQGRRLGTGHLFPAATAQVHGLTLVTHQGRLFANLSGLTVADWLTP